MTNFRRKTRVVYTGKTVPSLTGKRGVVIAIKRNGWMEVDFGDGCPIRCATINLTRETSGVAQ